jgi:NhaA family Na+:H+ antiporter
VLLGLLTPARGLSRRVPIDIVNDLYGRLLGQAGERHPEPVSPLDRLEHALHPFAAFVVMPVFALANAGVALVPAALLSPVALAAAAGLVVGKPLGILLFAWSAVRLGWAKLPDGVTWPVLIGASCLGGIGFTVALFIAGLAFTGPMRDHAKAGILVGSVVSGVLGYLILRNTLPRRAD